MRQQLAALVISSTVSGCSLLYNPNSIDLPRSDALDGPDSIDASPPNLELTDVGPRILLEGQGVGGSRPAILTITGQGFVDGVQVQLIVPGGEVVMFVVDNANIAISPARDVIAVPVLLSVDVARGPGMVPLTVRVTQGAVTKMLDGKVQLHNLNELTDTAVTDSALLDSLYSRIDHPTLITFAVTPNKPAARFRAVSSIVLGDVTANATAAAAGPGGATGGAVGTTGGGSGGGAGSLVGGAGGGGFSVAGANGAAGGGMGGAQIGEPLIRGYATNHGSGGGGGNGSVGGGSGGTIEVTAGGTVRVGKLEVNGANAAAGGVSGGGGGSGGVVLIRAGTSAELTGPITANPGAGSPGTGVAGGTGRSGRIRIDVPLVIGTPQITPPAHLGMSLDPSSPRSTTNAMQPVVAYGTLDDAFNVFVVDAEGIGTSQTTVAFGTTTTSIRPMLSAGYNHVCVTANGTHTVDEATNCIDLAYLP